LVNCNKKRGAIVPNEKDQNTVSDKEREIPAQFANNKVKFEIYGEEMIEKRVKLSGNSGRVYLPPNWVGHKVKIIRL
jgi:putative transposon-encoded protein